MASGDKKEKKVKEKEPLLVDGTLDHVVVSRITELLESHRGRWLGVNWASSGFYIRSVDIFNMRNSNLECMQKALPPRYKGIIQIAPNASNFRCKTLGKDLVQVTAWECESESLVIYSDHRLTVLSIQLFIFRRVSPALACAPRVSAHTDADQVSRDP